MLAPTIASSTFDGRLPTEKSLAPGKLALIRHYFYVVRGDEPTAVGNGYCLEGHPAIPPMVMIHAVGVLDYLYAQVPTAFGLAARAYCFTARKLRRDSR